MYLSKKFKNHSRAPSLRLSFSLTLKYIVYSIKDIHGLLPQNKINIKCTHNYINNTLYIL